MTRLTRIAVWTFGGIAGVLLLLLLLAVAARFFIETNAGRSWLVSQIESAASGPDQTLEIGSLTGDPLSAFRVQDVRISDGEGQWLELDSLQVQWSFWSLLSGVLEVERLVLDGVDVARLPAASAEEEPSSGLPQLPVDVLLERFVIRNVALAEEAVGTDAVLAAEGGLRLVEGAGYDLELTGRRTDRQDGSLAARVHYHPDDDVLNVDVTLDAPAGGVLSNLLNVPGRPGLALTISGQGPLASWDGRVNFQAGQRSVVDLAVEISRSNRVDVEISGRIDPRPFAELPMLNSAFDVSSRLHLRDQIVDIEALALDGPPASLRVFGSVDRERSAMDILFQVRPRDMAQLNELAAPAQLGETALDGRLSGPFDNPNLSLNIMSEQLEASGLSAENVFLTIMARRDDADFVISGTGGMNNLRYEDTELTDMPTLLLDARLPGDFSALDLERAEVRAPEGRLSASGTVSLSGGPLAVTVEADIPPQTRGDDMISMVLAPGLTAGAAIAMEGAESPLRVSDITLRHPWVTADGEVSMEEGEGAELGTFDIRVTDVGALGAAVGAPVTGSPVTISATVGNSWTEPRLEGRVQSESLTAGGAEIGNLDISLRNSPSGDGSQSGRMDLTAETLLGDTMLVVEYLVPGEGAINLSTVSLETPAGMLNGAFSLPRDGTPATGRLGGRIALGPELQEQTGVPLSGDVDLSLELQDELGTQGVVFTAGGEEVFLGPVALASLTAEALQTADTIDFAVAAQGDFQGHAELAAEGSFSSSDDRQTLMMRTFSLETGSHLMRLQEPMRVVLVPERVEIEPLTLALDDGTVDVSLRQRSGELALNLDFNAVPLGLADLADIPVVVGGRLSGTVEMAAQGETAQGRVDLALQNVDIRGGTARIRNLDGTIGGTWDGQRFSLRTDISGQNNETVALAADLPVVYSPESGGVSVPEDGGLSAEATWRGEVAPLWQALGSDADFLTGLLDAALSVTGTVAEPEVSGLFTLRDGTYRNVDFGTALQDLTADISLSTTQATIDSVSATDGRGGMLTASGVVDFPEDAPLSVSMEVAFDRLRAMSRPDVTATVSGELMYKLDDSASRLSGSVATNEVEVRLINSMSAEVVTLDVIELPVRQQEVEEQAAVEEEAAPPMMLDIDVDIPQQLFIRGRGLDSEWQGEMKVAGPADEFVLTGGVNVVRGVFEFAGKRFNLTQGDVRFTGNTPINPDVNIRAEYETSDITAIVSITGTSQDIDVSFSSTPAMPEDEVVSHILFEKGVTNLSAVEAIQLASAMRSLASGGEGFRGSVRSALGLDVLSFGSSDNGDGTVVRGGKYITKNVYLEVQSGTNPGSERVGVQVELTRNLSVESHMTENTGGDIGITWKNDY